MTEPEFLRITGRAASFEGAAEVRDTLAAAGWAEEEYSEVEVRDALGLGRDAYVLYRLEAYRDAE